MTVRRRRLSSRLAPAPPLVSRRLGLLAVACPAALYGFVGILVRQLDLPAVAIAGVRLALAALTVLALSRLGRLGLGAVIVPRAQRGRLLVVGAIIGLDWWLFTLALQLTEIGVATVISFSWPIWLSLFSRLTRLEVPHPRTFVALAMALAGIGLIAVRGGGVYGTEDLLGMGAALITSLTISVAIALSRTFDPAIPSATVNFWQSAIGACLLGPFAVAGLQAGTLDGRSIVILIVLGAVLTGVGGTLFVLGMRSLKAVETGIMAYLEPVSATLLAALILSENPGPRGIVGMTLIVAAGLWVATAGSQRPNVAPLQ